MKIGILNVQGDVSEHFQMVRHLHQKYDVYPVNVKELGDLQGISGLIIPGGESTVIYKILKKSGMNDRIIEMAKSGMPVMGTCAGAILLSSDTGDIRVTGMGLIGITIKRNAYGRQINSFIKTVDIKEIGKFQAVFIRAPGIESTGNCEVMSRLDGSPVMVRENNILAMTFHPELTGDSKIHEYFISMVRTVEME
ncbi:MAG: pyridoxal 5'-phosphate synthase glutaminase subunit PdxT [Ferroplasma sp.]|uniref:pyridoxal 5'-phosphate synthase glutaminase subunit PdxT n=1 Tax=Ferroplasma sp. TaxID=2591003 RepID=UPI00281623AB|nr:pyridoxal 5'-phosphate synthase glutaminase subunit PdxT [Ferroplasma sp.]WMT50466.1 MAG: pyridoxal 5'-phosphate synthase glutaminase subunit PdxT [Ferroplasma sp.]